MTSEVTREECLIILEDWLILVDHSLLSLWMNPGTAPVSRSAVRAAQRYVRDVEVAEWVHQKNVGEGRTVRSSLLPGVANTVQRATLPSSHIGEVNEASSSAVRSWSYGWSGRPAPIPVGQRLSASGGDASKGLSSENIHMNLLFPQPRTPTRDGGRCQASHMPCV